MVAGITFYASWRVTSGSANVRPNDAGDDKDVHIVSGMDLPPEDDLFRDSIFVSGVRNE
ncbi:MAG: hypothetical protein RJAPGHWK_002368 [Candidatus Fervidibacter sp.]